MKPFVFSLETKLKVAEIEENQIREQVRQANVYCRKCEDALKETDWRIVAMEKAMIENLQGICNLDRFKLFQNYMPVLKAVRLEKQMELESALNNLEDIKKHLVVKNREHKILVRLKEKEWEKYKAELNREEQKNIDEIAIHQHFNGNNFQS